MAIKKVILVGLFAMFLTGCVGTRVSTTTTTFYIPGHEQRGSISVVATNAEINNSLEFKHYKARFEQKLAANGYSIAANTSDADFVEIVSYGIYD